MSRTASQLFLTAGVAFAFLPVQWGNLSDLRDARAVRLMDAAGGALDPAIGLENVQKPGVRLAGRLLRIPFTMIGRWGVLQEPAEGCGQFPTWWWLARVEIGS